MFQYISKILLALTPGQRLWALVIVLIAIVAITLGPGFLKKNDCKDVLTIVNKQKTEISRLNDDLLTIEREYTEDRIKREKEIRILIGDLETEMKAISSQSRTYEKQSYMIDTVRIDSSVAYSPRMVSEKVKILPVDLSGLKHKVECLKEKIDEK